MAKAETTYLGLGKGVNSSATAWQIINFTPTSTGQATIEVTILHAEGTAGIGMQEYDAWGTVNSILKVEKNGSTIGFSSKEIASSAGTDIEALVVLGLQILLDIIPGGRWVGRIVDIVSFSIDLYELKGDLERLGRNVQEFQRIQRGDIFDDWRTFTIKLNVPVHKGQEYRIKVGLEALAQSFEVGSVSSASVAGFVRSVKISMTESSEV